MMKILRNLVVISIITLLCLPAQAQFGNRLNRAVQNAAERTAIRKAEEKTEQAVSNAIDKATEKGVQAAEKGAEKGVQAAEKGIEKGVEAAEKASATQSDPQPQPDPYTGPMRGGAVDAAKFPFDHGSYVQIAQALGIEVSSTVYFARSGEWQAVEDKSEIKMFGFTTKVNKLQITKGTTRWDMDLTEKTGTQYEIDLSSDDADAVLKAAVGGESTEGMEITELGQENYLGYPCRKVQVRYPALDMDVTCLSYGTLILKNDGRIGPLKTSTRIVSIDFSIPPASKFEVPAGVQITSY